ncbi:MAG: hypothetical protein COB46_08240 [Rhodospirillaceae bacterium]|nr:MAG: hypothetical protein COB46_08240 [Rhodospirillaceae bacterium]
MAERTTVDARGALCPAPLMELIATLKFVEIGDEIEVLTTDEGSSKDIPVWVNKVGHSMVGVTKVEDHWSVVMVKQK